MLENWKKLTKNYTKNSFYAKYVKKSLYPELCDGISAVPVLGFEPVTSGSAANFPT